MGVLVLSHADVHAALAPQECERAMAEVLAARARGEAYMPLRSVMMPPGAHGFMGLMPAYAAPASDDGQAGSFGLKAICLIPSNPQRGLDTHQGTVTLFDGETGVPTAIINASAVTEIRTAAVTAAATRTLAREDSRVLAILGAGVQARAHLRALDGVRAWEQVRVYAPTAEHVRALAAGTPAFTAAGSAEQAVAGADVVVTATSSRQPVLKHEWLGAGTHVNAVGASSPNAVELELATVAAAALFCDSRESLRNEAGEFILALAQGAISGEQHVRAELGEVLAGMHPGRTDPGELTLFRSLGIGVEDLAAAQLTVASARRLGLGTEVQL
jgi:ornithine cyclodeaminase/alanine dehydrogenase-like protein (mu-crystallin family)